MQQIVKSFKEAVQASDLLMAAIAAEPSLGWATEADNVADGLVFKPSWTGVDEPTQVHTWLVDESAEAASSVKSLTKEEEIQVNECFAGVQNGNENCGVCKVFKQMRIVEWAFEVRERFVIDLLRVLVLLPNL